MNQKEKNKICFTSQTTLGEEVNPFFFFSFLRGKNQKISMNQKEKNKICFTSQTTLGEEVNPLFFFF